jgi:chloramphenicol 3-O-phosphotransferase
MEIEVHNAGDEDWVNFKFRVSFMKLVFIHGAPAVGKLSVARELARLTGYRLFHNHLTVDLVTSLFDFGTEPFVELREAIWVRMFREAASRKVSLVFTFNPESTVRPRFIHDAVEAVESTGGKVLFVELVCSESEVERRMVDPSRGQFGKLQSLAQYKELQRAGAFQFPELPAGLTLDTTDRPPSETAALIASHFSLA